MPVNLQLGTVNAQGARTSRPSPSAGEGLIALGKSFSETSDTLLRLSNVTHKEDAGLAMSWFMDKSIKLDQVKQDLIAKYRDPFELNQAMGEQMKAFSEFAEKEAKQLGIPTLGSQKLTPRMLQVFDELQLHRSSLFETAGNAQLEKADALFREKNIPLLEIRKDERIVGTDGGETHKVTDGVIKVLNQNTIAQHLMEHLKTGIQIGNKYKLDPKVVQKWSSDSQEALHADMLADVVHSNYNDVLDPDFNLGTLGLEKMHVDPITQEISFSISRLSGTEKAALIKQAHDVKMARMAESAGDDQVLIKAQVITDLKTANKIALQFSDLESPQQALDAIADDGKIGDVKYHFETDKAKNDMISTLLTHQRAGGFPRESDQSILDELRIDLYANGLKDPMKILEFSHKLSPENFKELMSEMTRNQTEGQSQFKTNFSEQSRFIAGFWGNLTNFIGPMLKTENALTLKSQTIALNRILALPEGTDSRAAMQEITYDVLIEDAEAAIKAQLNIASDLPFAQMSAFKSLEEIDKLPNAQDRVLATMLLKMKEFRNAKSGTPSSGDDKVNPNFFSEKFQKAWDAFISIFTRDKN